jgi:ubiquinone/menaquinone biosynthesis C-methylase UbiE
MPEIINNKKNKKEISREVGLEIGSIFGRFFFQSNHLHYGYWNKNLPVDMQNLHIAQEDYAKFLVSQIPAGVKSILDVGCGTGQIAKALLDAGYKVDCVCPSAYMKKCAMELLGDKSQIFECFYEDLPVNGQLYDMVMFCESFQYVKIDQAFAKTQRLLKDGGYLLINDIFKTHPAETKPFMGGGHKIGKFNEFLARTAFKQIKKVDITDEMAPSIDLFGKMLEQTAKPAWECGMRFMESRFPFITKFLKWKYKDKIDRVTLKYFKGGITGENFKRDKRYLFLLYTKEAASIKQ